MNVATLVISLDFELAWGSPERWGDPEFIRKAIRTRDVAEQLLSIFMEYNIACTWATVGALFTENKDQFLEFAPEGQFRPTYHYNNISPYAHLDQITETTNPALFFPEIIHQILNSPKQELGSHTYSHYYCLEEGQTERQFAADCHAFQSISSTFGHTNTSFVFPRNQVNKDYVQSLSKIGITAVRGEETSFVWKSRSRSSRTQIVRLLRVLDSYAPLSAGNVYDHPRLIQENMIDIPSSRFMRPISKMDMGLGNIKEKKIINELSFASRSKGLYHIWLHPINFAQNRSRNMDMLKRFLNTFSELRSKENIIDKTMSEIADEYLLASQ